MVKFISNTSRDKKFYGRGFIKVSVVLYGRWFHVYNTHLTWRLEDAEIRQQQAEELYQFIKKHSLKKAVVIAGDFNSSSASEQFGILPIIQNWKLGKRIIQDTYRIKNPEKDGHTWTMLNPRTRVTREPDRRVDFIFFFPIKNMKVIRSKIVFNRSYPNIGYISDHFGVLTEISLGRKS
jgi:endonuclease/exonuclease/phosphatase family metal-dependent hydrolase